MTPFSSLSSSAPAPLQQGQTANSGSPHDQEAAFATDNFVGVDQGGGQPLPASFSASFNAKAEGVGQSLPTKAVATTTGVPTKTWLWGAPSSSSRTGTAYGDDDDLDDLLNEDDDIPRHTSSAQAILTGGDSAVGLGGNPGGAKEVIFESAPATPATAPLVEAAQAKPSFSLTADSSDSSDEERA
jgi:hypothetical protein